MHYIKAACAIAALLLHAFWTTFSSASVILPVVSICGTSTIALRTTRLAAIHQHLPHRPSVEKAPSPVDTVDCVEQVAVEELAANRHLHLIEGVLAHKVAVQIIDPAEHGHLL